MAQYQRRKQDRPDEIIEAAYLSFAEKGYADTRIEQVAKKAGVSKGLVYLYFKTKEELFKAVVRKVVVPRLTALDASIGLQTGSVADFLRGPFVDTAVGLAQSRLRFILRLLIAEGPKHPDLTEFYHREVISRGMRTLAAVVQKGVDQGEFEDTGLTRYPQLIVTPVVFSVVWKILFERHEELSVRQLLETHIELLLRALRPQPRQSEAISQ